MRRTFSKPGMLVEMHIASVTSLAAISARTASRRPSKSGKSRWQCESISMEVSSAVLHEGVILQQQVLEHEAGVQGMAGELARFGELAQEAGHALGPASRRHVAQGVGVRDVIAHLAGETNGQHV